MCTHLPWCTHGDQRATWGNRFSSPTMWVLGIKAWPPGSVESASSLWICQPGEGVFNLWDAVSFSKSYVCYFSLWYLSRFDRIHLQELTVACCSCLSTLPMKCHLKIKLPHCIYITCYAWSIVLWNRLVRVRYSQKSNNLPAWYCHWILALMERMPK